MSYHPRSSALGEERKTQTQSVADEKVTRRLHTKPFSPLCLLGFRPASDTLLSVSRCWPALGLEAGGRRDRSDRGRKGMESAAGRPRNRPRATTAALVWGGASCLSVRLCPGGSASPTASVLREDDIWLWGDGVSGHGWKR